MPGISQQPPSPNAECTRAFRLRRFLFKSEVCAGIGVTKRGGETTRGGLLGPPKALVETSEGLWDEIGPRGFLVARVAAAI